MSRDLNDTIQPYKDARSDDAVTYLQQMPLVIADGRVPIRVRDVFERRLNSQQPAWKNDYHDTGDGVAYDTKGDKFKVVVGADFLRTVNPESRLTPNGALILPSYEDAQGAEFSHKDKGLILNRDLTADEARTHPILRELAGDQELLNECVGRMFPEMKERFGYETAMGVYLAGSQKEATARALYVYGLEDWSQLRDRDRLVSDSAQLVGVAPEAQSAPKRAIVRPTLEQALAVISQHSGDLKITKR